MSKCKYVALITVTTAENNVKPIIMHTLNFFGNRIYRFQNALMGILANTISVIVVYALTQYE